VKDDIKTIDVLGILEILSAVIEKTFPLPPKFRHSVPEDIARLSHLLTNERESLHTTYMSEPALLGAYLRYWVPWNVLRLCGVFANDEFNFSDMAEDANLLDLGSGPLTFAIALYAAKPELRKKKLTVYCVDQNAKTLAAGEKLFYAFANELSGDCRQASLWKIVKIKGKLSSAAIFNFGGGASPSNFPKMDLVSAVNFYNELYFNIKEDDEHSLDILAKKNSRLLENLIRDNGRILVVEPGNPRGGHFISILRGKLLERNFNVIAPCTHSLECPVKGGVVRDGVRGKN
jgi:ribosomal protein RSM22 (predicted rRNA methylase)